MNKTRSANRGGAKASQTIMWLLYLCIKPETSEMLIKHFHAIVKVKNFTAFPAFPMGASGMGAICSPSYYWQC